MEPEDRTRFWKLLTDKPPSYQALTGLDLVDWTKVDSFRAHYVIDTLHENDLLKELGSFEAFVEHPDTFGKVLDTYRREESAVIRDFDAWRDMSPDADLPKQVDTLLELIKSGIQAKGAEVLKEFVTVLRKAELPELYVMIYDAMWFLRFLKTQDAFHMYQT